MGSDKQDGCKTKGSKMESLASNHHGIDQRLGLVPSLNVLLSGALPGKKSELLKRFMHRHKEELELECLIETDGLGKKLMIPENDLLGPIVDRQSRLERFMNVRARNLFVPIQLGGMGVIAPPNWKYKITINQRKVADHILGLFPSVSSQKPLNQGEYELIKTDRFESVPWDKKESLPSDPQERYKCFDGFFGKMSIERQMEKFLDDRWVDTQLFEDPLPISKLSIHYPHRCSKSFLRGPGFIPFENRPLVPLMC
jgi:hypothetical protein